MSPRNESYRSSRQGGAPSSITETGPGKRSHTIQDPGDGAVVCDGVRDMNAWKTEL